jgi:hypothetical protein
LRMAGRGLKHEWKSQGARRARRAAKERPTAGAARRGADVTGPILDEKMGGPEGPPLA